MKDRIAFLLLFVLVLAVILAIGALPARADTRPTCSTTVALTDRYAVHYRQGVTLKDEVLTPIRRHGCHRYELGIVRRYTWFDTITHATVTILVRLRDGDKRPFARDLHLRVRTAR